MMGVLGGQWAGGGEVWSLVPDCSTDLLCDLRQGRAPFWNSLALFTHEEMGLESLQYALCSNIHHLFWQLRFGGNTVERIS